MGTPDATKVAVLEGKVTGAIFVAPTTVPLPTDAVTPLPKEYKCIGFTSEDGVVISEDSSNNELRAWEGRAIVRNQKTEYKEQVTYTPIECNEEVARATWGDGMVSVDDNGNLTIKHHGQTMEPVHSVIEAVPYANAVARYCAKTQLAERGDQTANGEDNGGRELTFDCLANKEGVTMTEYIAVTAVSTPETASATPEATPAKAETASAKGAK